MSPTGGGGAYEFAADAKTGSKSIKLTAAEHSNSATWIQHDCAISRVAIRIDASKFEVGATYKASAWFKADKAGSQVNIIAQADPYTTLNEDKRWTDAGTEWVLKEVEFVMPEGVGTSMPSFSAVIGNLHPGAVLQRFEGGMGGNENPHSAESSQDPLFFERVLFVILGQM